MKEGVLRGGPSEGQNITCPRNYNQDPEGTFSKNLGYVGITPSKSQHLRGMTEMVYLLYETD